MTDPLARHAHQRCQCGHERQHHLDGATCQIMGCACRQYIYANPQHEPRPEPIPESQLFEVEV